MGDVINIGKPTSHDHFFRWRNVVWEATGSQLHDATSGLESARLHGKFPLYRFQGTS
jgi:hypothetical protein